MAKKRKKAKTKGAAAIFALLFAACLMGPNLNAQCDPRFWTCTTEYDCFDAPECGQYSAVQMWYTCVDPMGVSCVKTNLGTACVDSCYWGVGLNWFANPIPNTSPAAVLALFQLKPMTPGIYQRVFMDYKVNRPIKVKLFWQAKGYSIKPPVKGKT